MEYLKNKLINRSELERLAGMTKGMLGQKIRKKNRNKVTISDSIILNAIALNFCIEVIKEIKKFNLTINEN